METKESKILSNYLLWSHDIHVVYTNDYITFFLVKRIIPEVLQSFFFFFLQLISIFSEVE